jgi:hypothetical protein
MPERKRAVKDHPAYRKLILVQVNEGTKFNVGGCELQ